MGPVQQLLLKHLSWLIISPVFKKSILSTSGVGSILPLEDTSTAGISILPASSLPPTAYPRSQVKLCPELLAQMHWAAPCISFLIWLIGLRCHTDSNASASWFSAIKQSFISRHLEILSSSRTTCFSLNQTSASQG